MSNLILIGENIGTQNDSAQVQIISKALLSNLVNDISDFELFEEIKKRYIESHTDLKRQLPTVNGETDTKTISYTCKKIVDNLRKHKRNIRKDEIKIAFENGIHGLYFKVYDLSVVTFCDFITAYCIESNRCKALEAKNNKPEEIKKPSFDQIHQLAKDNAIAAFKIAKERKSIELLGPVVYDFLFFSRIFLINQAEIDELLAEAAKIYRAQLETKRSQAADSLKRKDYTRKLDDFNLGLVSNNAQVMSIAKRLKMEKYFRELIEFECSLDDFVLMIDEAKPVYEKYTIWAEEQRKIKLAEAAAAAKKEG